jgi:hypothetical protein
MPLLGLTFESKTDEMRAQSLLGLTFESKTDEMRAQSAHLLAKINRPEVEASCCW